MNSVAGIAVEQGKVFIARRKPGGDLGEKWEFPGGKVEEGEADADALRREYLEEFGVVVNVGSLLARVEFVHNERKFLLNAYRIFFTSYCFKITEHSEWRWAALTEIEGLDFAGSDRRLLPALQAYLETEAGINH
ncbi:MAG: (deoxy)nucleoside triphosphate pyrophosphohydrolase [Treponema sp.]|jgi:8-oxo-dGTP diphosphatase|nr:(deoxy)nucleoside triphosphate pyrophosphohydrolase [Treponema sp.]